MHLILTLQVGAGGRRRQNPDLFRMHRMTEVCGLHFTSMGNHFLLEWPDRQLVEMSRNASEAQINKRLKEVLAAAHNGAVIYTSAISKGEQRIARTVREKGFQLVVLLNKGFPPEGSPQERFYKPGGVYFDACSRGKLLLMEPHESVFIILWLKRPQRRFCGKRRKPSTIVTPVFL